MDREAYEGLLIAVLLASVRKVRAGLKHAATEEFQDYPPGCLELGTALSAINMIAVDMLQAMEGLEDEPIVQEGE